MIWRYLLKQLALPPGSLLLGLLLAWLLRKSLPRLAGGLFIACWLGLYLLCLPITTQFLARPLESLPALPASQWQQLAQQAGALVVLGGGREPADPAWGHDQPSLFASQRLRYAARLQRASGLPILVSGGLHYGRAPSEARIMADSLQQDYQVPTGWLEERSRTTLENAQFSAQILHAEGIRRIVLVTDAWHMQRSVWSFKQQGFTVIAAPQGFYSSARERPWGGWLPESRAFWQNQQLINEWLGLFVYRLQSL